VSRGFITFEGPEGAGKSTQIRLLADRLRANGADVVTTREPGGTAIGEQIRAVLLSSTSSGISAETEALLMTAARAQHVSEVIRPALERGQIVLCDRYVDSTIAYQGGGRGLSIDGLLRLQTFATGGLEPDLRVLLDLPVEMGLRRRRSGGEETNRLDDESLQFHTRVRHMYLELAQHPDWVVIDASRDVQAVASDVLAAVERFLSEQSEQSAVMMGRA
jgi:dTMP kinase